MICERDRIIGFWEDQLRISAERERRHLERIEQLSAQSIQMSDYINLLTDQIEAQAKTIESLEKALLLKEKDFASISGKARGMAKLLHKESEKITPAVDPVKEAEKPKAPTPKERGNNGAKRKEYFDMEEEIVDLWPGDPDFDKEKAIGLSVRESIRYTYYPCRFPSPHAFFELYL